MSVNYFSKFPFIKYNDTFIPNITLRVAFLDKVKQNATVFYPYIVQEGETADAIATWYYDRPDFDWLVYLANDIVDPHTQWPKAQQALELYIAKKYGNVKTAMSTIAFYRKYPDEGYLALDGSDFSIIQNTTMERVVSNQDVRITPDSYNYIDDQINYYPVYAYDYEIELNEKKRHITLIDNDLKGMVLRELDNLLNG